MKDQTVWDKRFLHLAREISSYSKDPSTRVGAVIVNNRQQVVGSGYNGFARGVSDDPERYLDRELKLRLIIHAEVNACIQAGKEAQGSTLYVWPSFILPPVCHECAKVVIQSGIKRVVGFTPNPEDFERGKRWEDSIYWSHVMFREAGVQQVEIYQ
jgi:dCMP deaminase